MKLPKLPAEEPKTFWERILTTTPVILTVVATLLAGVSSSEMTQAQYHRSLAAQIQSKVGDQWGFFQAKRIRETTLRTTIDLLHAGGKLRPEDLQSVGRRLPRDFERAEQQASRLRQAVADAKGELGAAGEPLRQAVEKLTRTAQEGKAKAQALQKEIDAADLGPALASLDGAPLTAGKEPPREDPRTRAALQAIGERRPDDEVLPLARAVNRHDLEAAIHAADDAVRAFDERVQPAARALARLGDLVNQLQVLVRTLEAASRDVADAEADLPEGKSLNDVRQAAAALTRTTLAAKSAVDGLRTDFLATRYDFDARRYRHEAEDNQVLAGLYEIQVRQSGASSERHRERSRSFFYGMLIAQAGVTISSLALAVHKKSVLWGLASLAGLAAVIFSGYVYLYT